MPLEGFICPNGDKVSVSTCLAGCIQPEGRCLTRSMLSVIASQEREWTGVPSTTQLLQGTRMSYLKITQPYYINPRDQAFSLLGTKVHKELAGAASTGAILEETLELDGITGTLDCYEIEDGVGILTDYKTWGSYRVAMALGMVAKHIPSASDPTDRQKSKSNKPGGSKTVVVWEADPSQADAWEAELQLNHYRLMLESHGYKVDKLQVLAIVRDGGTYTAGRRGIKDKILIIPIARMDDIAVRSFFQAKKIALESFLSLGEIPPPCSARETWDGRRCEEYCEVWEHCDVGRKARSRTHTPLVEKLKWV